MPKEGSFGKQENQNFASPFNRRSNDTQNISNYNMNNDNSNYKNNLSLLDQRNPNPLNKSKHIDAMESRAANMEALAKARYFALSQKRTLPPRCHFLKIPKKIYNFIYDAEI